MQRLNKKLPITISCNRLISHIKNNGTLEANLNDFILSSSWLKSVSFYKYDGYNVVIADFKSKKNNFTSKEYVFCDISNSDWLNFKYESSGRTNSYGERFWDYIKPNLCDCE